MCGLIWLGGCGSDAGLRVTGARLVTPLPGQTTAVAYLTIENRREERMTLVTAESNHAGAIEIHTHIRSGDRVRMSRVEQIDVESGGALVFEPGGLHLMVFRYAGPREGSIELTLRFANGETLPVEFVVESRMEATR
jgi:copper(I)-binding protein